MDTFEYDEKSSCACGKGYVVRHCVEKWYDSWSSSPWDKEYSNIDIHCPICKTKYHYETDNNTEYLVPNGKTLQLKTKPEVLPVINPYSIEYTVDKCMVAIFTKEKLQAIIDDMKTSKYSTRVALDESKLVIHGYYKKYHSKKLINIIKMLEDCLSNYDTYEWTFDKTKSYMLEEQTLIKKNKPIKKQVLSESYKLFFVEVKKNEI